MNHKMILKMGMNFLMAVALTSCMVGKDYQKPNIIEFTESGTKARTINSINSKFSAAEPVVNWWHELEDPILSRLIDDALRFNKDIKIAQSNVRASRALYHGFKGDKFPKTSFEAQITDLHLSENGINGKSPDSTISNYEVSFDSSWELDFFGRIDSQINAQLALLQADEARLQYTYVIVAAEVARAYIELRGGQHRLNVAKKNLDNQRKTLDLTHRLEKGGRSTDLDIARSRTRVLLTESSLPPLREIIDLSINRLSVLTGRTPNEFEDVLSELKPLPKVPPIVSIGDSESLIKRRPDILIAERMLASSVEQYNVNVANLYPRISLQGSIGFNSLSFSELSNSKSYTGNIAPSLSWSIFNRKGIKANILAADARIDENYANFEKTILLALEEIDSNIESFAHEELRRESLQQAAISSAKATELARKRFELGADSFLDVLIAERTQLDAEDRLAASDTEVFIKLISIYKALGGGWDQNLRGK